MSDLKKKSNPTIITNKKASYDYFFEKHLHAGVVLEGWEVKSIKAHKVQLSDSYVIIKNNEAWLIGTLITPLNSASTHKISNPTRTRKILLHRKEINSLIGLSKQKGYTLIPESMYWDKNKIKLQIGLAKGKKTYDKRAHTKEHDWKIQKQRLLKKASKF
jgi:SsrA-binding protein